MSSPTVSVVIPTHNRPGMTVRAVHSVLAQTLAALEILVVDDGSSDETADIVESTFPERVEVVRQSPCRGVSAARNRGVRLAKGDWVAFLDSDDEWTATKLAEQMVAITGDPNATLCHTDEVWIRRGRFANPRLRHAKHGGWIYRQCLALCAISPSTVLIRRDVFDRVGWFDESLPACEDYDFWLRFCCRYPVLFVPQALVTKYGGHDDQLSRQHWGMDRFRAQALEKVLCSSWLDMDDWFATRAVLCEKLRILEAGARKRPESQREGQPAHVYEQLRLRWLQTTPGRAKLGAL